MMNGHLSTSDLREKARTALRRGDAAEAYSAFSTLHERGDDDLESLNALAVFAAQKGQFAQAMVLLERAQALDPGDLTTTINSGLVAEDLGDLDRSVMYLRAALAIEPSLEELRLKLGGLLLRQDQKLEAATEFHAAILKAQRQGQWVSAATTPPHLHRELGAAMQFLSRFKKIWIAEALQPVREAYGPDALRRVDECVRAHLGEIDRRPASPLQKSRFLHFPGLPETPFFERNLFPWVDELEAQTATLREEAVQVMQRAERTPFLQLSEAANPADYLGGEKPEWTAYFFHRHGQRFDDHLERCPHTAAALSRLPLTVVPRNAPEVLFSVLGPGTHILAHTGVTNTRTVVHLPLIVPENCALMVGRSVHHWETGRCVMFDDTFEHEAWNRSDAARVILLFDVWNPHLTAPECEAIARLVPAIEQAAPIVGSPPSS